MKSISLFDGADKIIDSAIGAIGASESYRSKTAFDELIKARSNPFDGKQLVKKLYASTSNRWEELLLLRTKRPPSSQNWRWAKPKLGISKHNDGPEETLERALLSACNDPDHWNNQIPVASGIGGPSAHKRSAIDIVHKRGESAFDFIELKVESDTPISAAFQIALYGLVWILSKRDRDRLQYPETPILEAKDITLSVLAPKEYYRKADLSWLSEGLSKGLGTIAKREAKASMTLVFEEFPKGFQWPAEHSPKALYKSLDKRRLR